MFIQWPIVFVLANKSASVQPTCQSDLLADNRLTTTAHSDRCTQFCVIVVTNPQTNKQTQ